MSKIRELTAFGMPLPETALIDMELDDIKHFLIKYKKYGDDKSLNQLLLSMSAFTERMKHEK